MKNALVILDMLNDFVDGTLANSAAKPIIHPIATLADKARQRDDWVVIFANDAHHENDLEFKVFGEHAVAGTEGAAVVAELSPQEGDIVLPKRFYSAFTQTDLDATLRVHSIGRVAITGQHTNCCCRHTSYDAFERGLQIVAITDATCVFEPMFGDNYDQGQHDALQYLQTFYKAELAAADELL
jgi:nicotinamidase-related amidase